MLALGVDYVELDVRRRSDGSFVVAHNEDEPDAVPYAEYLGRLAGRAGAHVDLKVDSDNGVAEVEAAGMALRAMGADDLVLTTESVPGARALRDWADSQGLALRIGLSVGRPVHRLSTLGAVRLRVGELLSTSVRDSGATVVASRHTLARLGMAWLAHRRGLPLLVWTVDDERHLSYWLRPGRAWMVVTNEPELALRLRDSVR